MFNIFASVAISVASMFVGPAPAHHEAPKATVSAPAVSVAADENVIKARNEQIAAVMKATDD